MAAVEVMALVIYAKRNIESICNGRPESISATPNAP
jgi:hypothetical protein